MNNKLLTKCEHGPKPSDQEQCDNYLDGGHGQCWCFIDLEGLHWCNEEFCKKGENNKND